MGGILSFRHSVSWRTLVVAPAVLLALAVVVFTAAALPEATIYSVYTLETQVDKLWSEGIKGSGVRIALIDTGVHSAVPEVASKVVSVDDPSGSGTQVRCVNFSGEPHCDDSYGHGTFLAGLMVGSGRPDGTYRGVAPEAEIISIKIAGRDGSADVSKVLAAIQWAVSFRDKYNIKVINLSLGTTGRATPNMDPLNFAVQRAWDAGMAVVVSAGNRGPGSKTISKPGDDPLVITAGAVDDRETPAIDDDRLPKFSSRGPTIHGVSKPDLVAPGSRLVSLRSPSSRVEEVARAGGIDSVYRRGSGTSMSTAVLSGVAALVFSANSKLTPDQLKLAMIGTAHGVAATDVSGVGAGLVDAYATGKRASSVTATQKREPWVGGASLDESRGTVTVTRPCTRIENAMGMTRCELRGDVTAQGREFNLDDYREPWTEKSWADSQWVQSVLMGSSWYSSEWWDGSSWYGSSWYGSSWYGNEDPTSFYGTSLEGSSWYGAWQ